MVYRRPISCAVRVMRSLKSQHLDICHGDYNGSSHLRLRLFLLAPSPPRWSSQKPQRTTGWEMFERAEQITTTFPSRQVSVELGSGWWEKKLWTRWETKILIYITLDFLKPASDQKAMRSSEMPSRDWKGISLDQIWNKQLGDFNFSNHTFVSKRCRRFRKMYNCLYLPNEALSKSLQPRRKEKKKSSQAQDLTWAKLLSLPTVAARPDGDFAGGEVVYYSSCCHSSRGFRGIVLFSPDATPLIHVPDLRSQPLQTEGNLLERLKNQRGRPALPRSLSPAFPTAASWGGGSGVCLYQQDKTLEDFNPPHNLPSPLPTPLATEQRSSDESNFKKENRHSRPGIWELTLVIVTSAQWHEDAV